MTGTPDKPIPTGADGPSDSPVAKSVGPNAPKVDPDAPKGRVLRFDCLHYVDANGNRIDPPKRR